MKTRFEQKIRGNMIRFCLEFMDLIRDKKFTTSREIATRMSCSIKTARRWLQEAEDLGLVRVEIEYTRVNDGTKGSGCCTYACLMKKGPQH